VGWEVDLHDDFVPEYSDLHKDVQTPPMVSGAWPSLLRPKPQGHRVRKGLKPSPPQEGAAQLIAAEMTLQPGGVSKLEKRSDFLLSTPRKAVDAMGGRLSLSFPIATL
jgi:hypothetical protein